MEKRLERNSDILWDKKPTLTEVGESVESLSLAIGGISFTISGMDISFLDLLRKRYHWFISSATPDYKVWVQIVPYEELVSKKGNEFSQPLVEQMDHGENYLITRFDNPFVAKVDMASKKVLVKMRRSEYCFDSFLRILLTLILAREGGVLIHASAVSRNDRGYVFFGPSESGKTTITRLSTHHTILTDELAVIKPHNGGYRVYGTPFWGEFKPGRSNFHTPLYGLYALKKDTTNKVLPINKVQAIEELYQCILFFSRDAQLFKMIFDICCAIVDAVPIRELHFYPDTSFWQVIS
jgi:hypothetical protein